jgi:hypothetical protein
LWFDDDRSVTLAGLYIAAALPSPPAMREIS